MLYCPWMNDIFSCYLATAIWFFLAVSGYHHQAATCIYTHLLCAGCLLFFLKWNAVITFYTCVPLPFNCGDSVLLKSSVYKILPDCVFELISSSTFLSEAAADGCVCSPSSSLSADLLSTISMQKSSEWHSQQGGLITPFNQLHRWGVLFRPGRFEFVFCVSTGQIHWQSWALHLSHTSPGGQIVILAALQ